MIVTIGDRLMEAMLRRGLNQAQLAALAGLSRAAVTQIMKGVRHPSRSLVTKLASILDVSTDYLLGTGANVADFHQDQLVQELATKFLLLPADRQTQVLDLINTLLAELPEEDATPPE